MKSTIAKTIISPIQASDYSTWARLFRAYVVDFYKASIPEEQYPQTFKRITDPTTDLYGVALREADSESGSEGRVMGIMHFFPHQTPWSDKQIMHVNDLFIDPEFRGNGYGRQMLQEAGRIAKEQGCLRVQWATQHGNPARKLYDELGVCNFVEYRMQI